MTEFHYPVLSDEAGLPIYVLGAGARDTEGHFLREGGYPNYQIIYCTRGAGVLKVGGGEYTVRAGDAMYLPPNVPHEYYPVQDIWETHWLAFDGREAGAILRHIRLEKAGVVHISELSTLESIFKKILYLMRTNYYYCGFECSSLMYSFLIEFNRVVNLQSGEHNSQKLNRLRPVIDYIESNYQSELTLTELAEVVDLSPQYLCRMFKECMNMRPFEYLARKRVQQAKLLLVEDKLNINEIATSVGYNDCSYFCAVFKKQEMLSPAEFRSLHRKAGV